MMNIFFILKYTSKKIKNKQKGAFFCSIILLRSVLLLFLFYLRIDFLLQLLLLYIFRYNVNCFTVVTVYIYLTH